MVAEKLDGFPDATSYGSHDSSRKFQYINYAQVTSKVMSPITRDVRVNIGRNLALNAELHHDPLVLKRDIRSREGVGDKHIA